MANENENKNKKRSLLIILAILLIVFGGLYAGYYVYMQYDARQEQNKLTTVSVSEDESATDEKLVKNPVDFASLQSGNEDIYAWLKVPGTKVDHPVVQSPYDDEFYLKHSAIDKSWVASGAVYTQLCNSLTFNDRVTVIYGHNGYSDTMFTTLHYFEDGEFFAKHTKFYIYTPSSRLTYKIVSAFKYDDRHIMNSFDFQNNSVFLDFQDMIRNPETTNKQVADTSKIDFNLKSRIVVLSTCITNQPSNRYLVCGVLVKNEKTD